MLRKAPAFALVAALTLGIGIGANTAIFTFLNALFLQPLSVPGPDRIVRLTATDERRFQAFSYPVYLDIRDRSRSFAGVIGHQMTTVTSTVDGEPAPLVCELATGNYFEVLRVGAQSGRVFTKDDDRIVGGHPVAVISHALWQSRFGGTRKALGARLDLNGHPFEVIGVAPPSFRGSYGAYPPDVWVPMAMHEVVRPRGLPLTRRGWSWMAITARLRDGVAIEQAQAELSSLATGIDAALPAELSFGIEVMPAGSLPEEMQGATSRFLGFAGAVVVLVLLVTCANIAGVLQARLAARRREFAVRLSLGAGRWRLARQLLIESLLLACIGGAAGLLFARWTLDLLMSARPAIDTARNFEPDTSLSLAVLAFTGLTVAITGSLFGLLPACRAAGSDAAAALKEESAGTAGSRHRSRLRGLIVVSQVAASVVLLVIAGLLVRSLRNAGSFDVGFDPQNLLVASVDLQRHGFTEERGRQFFRNALARLERLPGVRAVTTGVVVPLGFAEERQGFRIPGHTSPTGSPFISIGVNVVGPDYFRTMGMPLVRGRAFDPATFGLSGRPEIVVNETMARRFWPMGDAIGQQIHLGAKGPQLEIIGIVRDIKYRSLGEAPRPFVYAPFGPIYSPSGTFHVRTDGPRPELLKAIERELRGLEPKLMISEAMTFDELRSLPLYPQTAMAVLSGAFGMLAALLMALGVYGTISTSVALRTQEIGIRMAFGARPGDVLRKVIGEGALFAAAGLGVGLVASLAVSRLLRSQLFEVEPTDPVTFLAVASGVLAVALTASYLPARRAAKVDPLVALRHDLL
jgi:predicted permease